mmetsp:Transcript_41287/g.133002  ORF Transcript_41287/g.133002 Transcript_41287/m.133002 type:complete len:280 (+) Transcript_41287:1327-2166(+)
MGVISVHARGLQPRLHELFDVDHHGHSAGGLQRHILDGSHVQHWRLRRSLLLDGDRHPHRNRGDVRRLLLLDRDHVGVFVAEQGREQVFQDSRVHVPLDTSSGLGAGPFLPARERLQRRARRRDRRGLPRLPGLRPEPGRDEDRAEDDHRRLRHRHFLGCWMCPVGRVAQGAGDHFRAGGLLLVAADHRPEIVRRFQPSLCTLQRHDLHQCVGGRRRRRRLQGGALHHGDRQPEHVQDPGRVVRRSAEVGSGGGGARGPICLPSDCELSRLPGVYIALR